MSISRRHVLSLLASLPLLGLVSTAFLRKKPVLEPTPACDDHDEPTPAQTEGPYFTPDSPSRSSLLAKGMPGTLLVITGRVVNTNCQPVAKALLDWWQADDAGEYDNQGYTLRGHHYTDANGNFRLETIVPGLYPGRTRHLHVKVQAPNRPVLTTQLDFPNESQNKRDYIFKPALVMKTQKEKDKVKADYTFVLKA